MNPPFGSYVNTNTSSTVLLFSSFVTSLLAAIFFTSLLLLYSLIIDILTIFIKGNKSFQAGRLISHLGFGLLVLSIALNANLSVEKNLNIKVGEHFEVDKYKLFFENLIGKTEANYDTIVGNFLYWMAIKILVILNLK